MLWTPEKHALGDITIVRVGTEYHLFTEQTPLDAGGDSEGVRTVGHAVSQDLFHWEELPPAIGCGPAGAFDAYAIYHMDVFVFNGTWRMYYTGLDKSGPGQQQSVGVATSPDGVRWTKHEANPILRADPRWYEPAVPREATYQEKDFGRLWFRDPCVIRDAATGRFGMIVIARDLARHPDVRGCLAWATSDDLVRWEPHPPVYSPGRFHTIETPSIFAHNGRHYIMYMTHPNWGAPVMTTDPYQTAGDLYAVSESGWAGPYVPPADEIVVAAHGPMRLGAQRTVDGPDGERYLYGWLVMAGQGDDLRPGLAHGKTMPAPRRVRFLEDGRMQVVYYDKIESFFRPTRITPEAGTAIVSPEPSRWHAAQVATGKDLGARSIATLPGEHGDLIFSARVRFVRGERAGLILRADAGGTSGWRVVADRRFGRVEFGTLDNAHFIDARLWEPKDEVELKVVARGESVEVYADDRLMIHQVRYREKSGRVGYLVERAEAGFSGPRVLQA